MSIYVKFSKVQSQLNIPKATINDYGNFNYRNAEKIYQLVKPILAENGLALMLSDDVVAVGDRLYVKATATLIDIETGETMTSSALAREAETKTKFDDSQITESASSYARKTCLCGMFLISEVDKETVNEMPVKEEFISPMQKSELMREMVRTGVTKEDVLTTACAETLDDINVATYEALMNKFKITPERG